jgi:aspartate racemase
LRKLGLIGGMSWISTRTYYERINRLVQKSAGPTSSAPLLIESLDYAPLYKLCDEEGWDLARQTIGDAAERLEQAGAGALVICSNSKHRVYDDVAGRLSIPIIHVADVLGKAMADAGVKTAALLGTHVVMTEGFYRRQLVGHGIDLLAPDMDEVATLDGVIFDELMMGKATRDAERALKSIIRKAEQGGAEALVLGCTELDLVVSSDANVLPIFNSGKEHCKAAASWILGED